MKPRFVISAYRAVRMISLTAEQQTHCSLSRRATAVAEHNLGEQRSCKGLIVSRCGPCKLSFRCSLAQNIFKSLNIMRSVLCSPNYTHRCNGSCGISWELQDAHFEVSYIVVCRSNSTYR